MKNTSVPIWSILLCFTTFGFLAIELCYASDEENGGLDPNVIIKEYTKLLDPCPQANKEKSFTLAAAAPADNSTIAKEKAEITKNGCTRKFIEQSGYSYDEHKTALLKKCKEENAFVNQTFEFGTIYENQRRYTFACTAELQCYEIKKGAWTSSPMLFSFYEKQSIKGPLK